VTEGPPGTDDPRPVLCELALDGRRALVTGAGSGLGRAIAVALGEAGARLRVAGRRPAALAATAQEIAARGGEAVVEVLDVTSEAAVERCAERIAEEWGSIDIVVNCAGNLLFKPFVPLPGLRPEHLPEFSRPISAEEWADVFAVHVGGPAALLRCLGPAMLEQRHGRVINVTTASLGRTGRFTTAYDVAKAALAQLTRSLAHEWARFGVTVNALAPGHFPTEMTGELHTTEQGQRYLEARVPMRRAGDVRDIGAAAVFLASDRASYVTGQTLYVDGGESL
jgi:NAD(P)-dependent dehydrogenase (short-subunit alcohol dehydrogenase family)